METAISRLPPRGRPIAILAFFLVFSGPQLWGQETDESSKVSRAVKPSLSKDKDNSAGVQAETSKPAKVSASKPACKKRRQVFIEAALVQVPSDSILNRMINLMIGNPDDRAWALFATSLGLKGIDLEKFKEVSPEVGDCAVVTPGSLPTEKHRGKLPTIIRLFKSHGQSEIIATPFVLADENTESKIAITATSCKTLRAPNQNKATPDQPEEAGIKLGLIPTISETGKSVLLRMELDISEFEATPSEDSAKLPSKISNCLSCSVTIPDKQVVVLDGFTRQVKRRSISKIPILGQIPLLGSLFSSEETVQKQKTTYIFLQAHIITDRSLKHDAGLER